MNTGKQINVMVVVLFVTLIAMGAYTIWDPFRSDSAADDQTELAAERGATTFALNCRLCHGDRGEGGQAGGRLPQAFALDQDFLRGFEQGVFNEEALKEAERLITNTISCGRVGTFMPPWGADQGGPLNEEQIRQLVVLITEGQWGLAQRHADELDAEASGHATVEMPRGAFGDGETELIVSNAAAFTIDQYIRIGDERLRILPYQLEVERGVDGTEAAEHDMGTPILRTEVVPGEEPATGNTLKDAVTAEDAIFTVSGLTGLTIGEVIQMGDERLRIVGTRAGLPSTGQQLAEEIGRTPDSFLVSGSDRLEVGAVIRLGGELMEITAIRDDGDSGTVLDTAVSASDTLFSVDDPTFYRPEYVFRVGDEHIRVIGAVDTEQTLEETIGRAQTTIFVSGSDGISVGMVIRMGSELLRITEIHPAFVEVDRGVDGTSQTTHTSGAAILKAEVDEDEEPDTGQTLLETADANATTFVIAGMIGIAVGETFRLGGEVVQVTRVEPARLRVERGADGSDREEHSRRAPIFERNVLKVERGVSGTPAPHAKGDSIFLTSLDVKRSVADSPLEPHAKTVEIFLGHRLIVERGALNTTAAEHENGELVYNFPTAPEGPDPNVASCGQRRAITEPTPGGPTATPEPTPLGAEEVTVSLTEFAIAVDPATLAGGPVIFQVANDGAIVHNLRVIATDLAPGDLPTISGSADEEQLEVVASTSDVDVGGTEARTVAQLAAGNYTLICNIPGHYLSGMFVGFEVTPQ